MGRGVFLNIVNLLMTLASAQALASPWDGIQNIGSRAQALVDHQGNCQGNSTFRSRTPTQLVDDVNTMLGNGGMLRRLYRSSIGISDLDKEKDLRACVQTAVQRIQRPDMPIAEWPALVELSALYRQLNEDVQNKEQAIRFTYHLGQGEVRQASRDLQATAQMLEQRRQRDRRETAQAYRAVTQSESCLMNPAKVNYLGFFEEMDRVKWQSRSQTVGELVGVAVPGMSRDSEGKIQVIRDAQNLKNCLSQFKDSPAGQQLSREHQKYMREWLADIESIATDHGNDVNEEYAPEIQRDALRQAASRVPCPDEMKSRSDTPTSLNGLLAEVMASRNLTKMEQAASCLDGYLKNPGNHAFLDNPVGRSLLTKARYLGNAILLGKRMNTCMAGQRNWRNLDQSIFSDAMGTQLSQGLEAQAECSVQIAETSRHFESIYRLFDSTQPVADRNLAPRLADQQTTLYTQANENALKKAIEMFVKTEFHYGETLPTASNLHTKIDEICKQARCRSETKAQLYSQAENTLGQLQQSGASRSSRSDAVTYIKNATDALQVRLNQIHWPSLPESCSGFHDNPITCYHADQSDRATSAQMSSYLRAYSNALNPSVNPAGPLMLTEAFRDSLGGAPKLKNEYSRNEVQQPGNLISYSSDHFNRRGKSDAELSRVEDRSIR